jgi:hypothetical protein
LSLDKEKWKFHTLCDLRNFLLLLSMLEALIQIGFQMLDVVSV